MVQPSASMKVGKKLQGVKKEGHFMRTGENGDFLIC
jgi:hypothetical protein